jgi:hypothetical protein
MHVTDLLIAEHRLLRVMMKQLGDSVRRRAPVEHLRAQASIVAAAFADHAQIEEDVLAPTLRHLSSDAAYFTGNMQVMDDVIALMLGEVSQPGCDVPCCLQDAIRLAEAQFDEEEAEVFPMAVAARPSDTQVVTGLA